MCHKHSTHAAQSDHQLTAVATLCAQKHSSKEELIQLITKYEHECSWHLQHWENLTNLIMARINAKERALHRKIKKHLCILQSTQMQEINNILRCMRKGHF